MLLTNKKLGDIIVYTKYGSWNFFYKSICTRVLHIFCNIVNKIDTKDLEYMGKSNCNLELHAFLQCGYTEDEHDKDTPGSHDTLSIACWVIKDSDFKKLPLPLPTTGDPFFGLDGWNGFTGFRSGFGRGAPALWRSSTRPWHHDAPPFLERNRNQRMLEPCNII